MTTRIINYGSINIDHVYRVPHFVTPGETLSSLALDTGLGGKGANQSAAIALAGGLVTHVGQVSKSDRWVVQKMSDLGIDTQYIVLVDDASGHAIIQVDPNGENAIVLHGGANQSNDISTLEKVLDAHNDAAYLLLQNECNELSAAIRLAKERGIKVALNPAPMSADIKELLDQDIDLLIVNQVEAAELSDETELDKIIQRFTEWVPNTRVVLTLGAQGVQHIHHGKIVNIAAKKVNVVDTTGAGDTFVGYFLALLTQGKAETDALKLACAAAAKAVTKPGAISAIPARKDI